MDLLPIAFFAFILFRFGMGVYALTLSARASKNGTPRQEPTEELRRIAKLAAMQLLEPGLSLDTFLSLSRLTESPFNLFRSSDWGGLGLGVWGFGLVLYGFRLIPLRVPLSWTKRHLPG